MKKTLSWLIVLAMVFAMIPAVFAAEESEVTYTKISSMEELTDGQYVIVCANNVGLGYLDGTWVLTSNPTIEGDVVTDAADAVWTITVDGTNVKLADKNGKFIKPKAGNNNGIEQGSYDWAVSVEDGMFVFAGQGSDTTKLASNVGSANKFRAYKNGTIESQGASKYPYTFALYKLDEAAEEPEAPVEPELPEGGLVLGNNDFVIEAGVDTIEFTYTAAEAGNVTVEFTKMGYQGSAGLTDKPVDECFAGANGTTIWFNAYINDVQMPAGYKGAVEVEAGETITIKVVQVGGTYFVGKVREGSLTIGMEAGSSEGGDVVEPVEGEIFNVETTDTYGYFDTYTFVAPVSGEYTFHIPAGLGLTTPEKDANWEMPIIDFYDNAEGYAHVIDLYAGQEYEVMVGALEKANWEIIYTVVEKEVEGPTEPDVPPVVEGETVVIGTNAGKVDTMYIFTATEAGTLKIDATTGNSQAGALQGSYYNSGWLTLEVDGVAVDGLLQGVYTMEVAAGQVVSIQVKAGWQMFATATPNIILSMEAASEGGEEGGEEGGLILGENNIEGDIEYTYTADAEGTLTINGVGGKVEVGTFGAQNISAYYYQNSSLLLIVNGETIDAANAGVAEIGLKAGDSVTIKIGYGKDTFKNAAVVLTLSFVEGSIGGDVEEPETPVEPEQPEVGSGDGTAGNPFIIEVPYEIEQDASADLYYQFTAPEDGKILILFASGVVGVEGANWETMTGGKYIEVTAGAVIKLNVWNGATNVSIAYEEVSDEFQGTILESVNAVNVSVSAGETVLYKWVATKDGELTVTLDSYSGWYGTYLFNASVNGQDMRFGAIVLNVVAGDEIIFQFSAAGYAGDGSLVFSASYPEEHVCDFVEVERVDETCTVDGYVKYECECGEHYTETLTAPGSHNFVEGSCGICGEADPDYVPECEHNYVDGVCTNCGEADPDYVPEQPGEPSNPGTGSMNILAIALIAMMSATAVVVTAKKSDEE